MNDTLTEDSIPSQEKKTIISALVKSRTNKDLRSLTKLEIPPHGMVIASLLNRLFLERMSFLSIISILLVFSVWQGIQNSDLRSQVDHPDSYIVPSNISDLLHIRANTIPDRLVYDFAEYFVQDLMNFNFEDVETRFRDLNRYMNPNLKAKFNREMRESVDLWKLRKIDQVFSFEKAKKFTRKRQTINSQEKDVFQVEIWGVVRRYLEGRPIDPYKELVTLSFTTSQVTSDKPWVFEVVDIKRQSQQSIEDNKNMKD